MDYQFVADPGLRPIYAYVLLLAAVVMFGIVFAAEEFIAYLRHGEWLRKLKALIPRKAFTFFAVATGKVKRERRYWEAFYRERFGREIDFGSVKIPDIRYGERLLFVPKGLELTGPFGLLAVMQKEIRFCYPRFVVSVWYERYDARGDRFESNGEYRLDEKIEGIRTPTESYAIGIKEGIGHGYRVADVYGLIVEKRTTGLVGVTLLEGLVYFLERFSRNKYLDEFCMQDHLFAGSYWKNGNVVQIRLSRRSLDITGCDQGELFDRLAILAGRAIWVWV